MNTCSQTETILARSASEARSRRPSLALRASIVFFLGLMGQSASAQPRFVPLAFDPNLDSIIEARFKMARDLEPLRKLADQIPLDSMKFNDERIQQLLQNILKENHGDTNLTLDKLKGLQEKFKNMQPSKFPPIPPSTPLEPNIHQPPQEPTQERELSEGLKRLMEKAETLEFGDWLKENSSAWNDTLKSLNDLSKLPKQDLNPWLEKMLPRKMPTEWVEKAIESLPTPPKSFIEKVSLPRLNKGSPPRINLGSWSQLPTFSIGSTVYVLLAVVFVGLVAWQIWRFKQHASNKTPHSKSSLGPWPVAPDAITTRTELIRAFDYLALLKLGSQARTWNHRQVADSWAIESTSAQVAALGLARLYETARYTLGSEILSEVDRDQARQALLVLQEEASS